jgi:hypothetical protein
MSSRRWSLVLAIALVPAIAPAPLVAQTLDALQARRASLRDSLNASIRRLEAAEADARTVPDTAIVVAGVTVRFPRADFPVADRRRLQRAIELAATSLVERHGDEGRALIDGDVWVISAPLQPSPLGPVISITVENGPRASASAVSELPLQSDRITRLVFDRASQRAVERSAVIRDYVGPSLLLEPEARTHYFAYRALATSLSSPARRCARGVVPDCSIILDPGATGRWFDEGDLAPNMRPQALAGPVRTSLLKFALERGGEPALRALRTGAGTKTDAIEAIAALAQMPVPDLVTQWQVHIASFADQRAGVPLPLAVTSLAWGGLLLALATRRRGE